MSLLDPVPPNNHTEPGFPIDQYSCALLGPTALIVQALMGVLVILSLVYKRHREKTKRPWKIWLLDVSKQIIGQMFVHGVNVLISDVGSHHASGNACVFYFLNILVDTTLGVALIYMILRFVNHILIDKLEWTGFESGQYGTPPSVTTWMRQAAVYISALTTMKLLVVALFALYPGIFKIGDWLLSWTRSGDHDAFQVIFTMGLFPIIMNILQFWLIDSIVKASADSPVTLDSDSSHPSLDEGAREPLFHSPSDDEDEDADDDDFTSAPRHDIENPRQHRSQSRDEQKSTSASTSVRNNEPKSQAGSSTHVPVDTEASVVEHAYPPSIISMSPPSRRASLSPPAGSIHRYKRSTPAPLRLHSVHQPATDSPNSITAKSISRSSQAITEHAALETIDVESSKDWQSSWDDSEEWTNKVDFNARVTKDSRGSNDPWRSPSLPRQVAATGL